MRVAGVDCPEKGQPFGAKARQFTADLVFGRSAQIKVYGRDRYGRTLGDVILADGRALSRELVKAGYAWLYRAYSKDKKLEALEAEARLAKRGLWADPYPVAPWDWRRPTRERSALRAGVVIPGESEPPVSPALSKSSGDEIVYVADSGAKYHRAGCRALKSALPARLQDAVRKYEPCRLCRPPTMRILPAQSRADDVVSVRIVGTVQPVAIDLSAVAGEKIARSAYGSSIVFSRGDGKMSPIHWGSISATK